MKTSARWRQCVANYDAEVDAFIQDYFASPEKRTLLIAGAGFDPRSAMISRLICAAASFAPSRDRVKALFLREHRPNPDKDLLSRGDAHAAELAALTPDARILDVEVLSSIGKAVVGGQRAIKAITEQGEALFEGVTDIVLDVSALSIGVSFPIARLLYEKARDTGDRVNFHIFVASNPELDAAISSVSADEVDPIRGFSGDIGLEGRNEDPKIWLPYLAKGRNSALQRIRNELRGPVDVCPVLPLSQRTPRAADEIMEAFAVELSEQWEVDARNLVFAIEDDPLDLYRTIVAILGRYRSSYRGVAEAHLVLSPSGNKVLAIGALMAAIEHALPVRYVEAVSYEVDWSRAEQADPMSSRLVHIWLHGAPYPSCGAPTPGEVPPASLAIARERP